MIKAGLILLSILGTPTFAFIGRNPDHKVLNSSLQPAGYHTLKYSRGSWLCSCGYTKFYNPPGNWEHCVHPSGDITIEPISCESCASNLGFAPSQMCN